MVALTVLFSTLMVCHHAHAHPHDYDKQDHHASVVSCPEVWLDQPEQTTIEAQRIIEVSQMEEHVRTEAFSIAIPMLKIAARNGDLGGQFYYGALYMGVSYAAKSPDIHDPYTKLGYIDSLSWLLVAAHRGHPQAMQFFTREEMSALLDPNQPIQLAEDGILSELPLSWQSHARKQAAAWAGCYQ